MISDNAHGIYLIQHIFLDSKLVDDLILDTRPGHHIMYIKMKRQVTGFCQVTHDTCGIDNQKLVVGINMDPSERHLMTGTIYTDSQVQRNGKAFQSRRERFKAGAKGFAMSFNIIRAVMLSAR